ncbi:MAG: hypothetical protein ACR2OF_04575, partial [Hyphomicrobium sp.]
TARGFVHWRFSDVGHASAPHSRSHTTSEKPTQTQPSRDARHRQQYTHKLPNADRRQRAQLV